MANVSVQLKGPLADEQVEFIKRALSVTYPDISVVLGGGAVNVCTAHTLDGDFLQERIKTLLFVSRGISQARELVAFTGVGEFHADPLPQLIESGAVGLVAPGMFQFQGDFLKVFKSLNQLILRDSVKLFSAKEQENPILWPTDLYKKINYFGDFPQQALLLVGAKRDEKSLRSVADKYGVDADFECVMINSNFEPSTVGVQSAVCDTCYYALRGRKDVSDVAFTTYNKVFRNESSPSGHLDRLPVFSVRDIIFIGSELFVLGMRQRAIDYVSDWIKNLSISCTIAVADDPFFVGSVEKAMFQSAFELKYEMLANIPFMSKSIAIGSINYHVDSFGRAFDIRSGGEYVHSACVGFGFERVSLALFSQLGPDIQAWPQNVRAFLHLDEAASGY